MSVPTDALLQAGGSLGAGGRARHFGDPRRELEAALHACALLDRGDRARISATGRDVLDLLHRLSTQDLRTLAPGDGRSAVLTTPKGRIVDRILVHALAEGEVLILAGPGCAGRVISHVRRFMFAEDATLAEVGDQGVLLAIVGPEAPRALEALGLPAPPRWGVVRVELESCPVHLLGHDGWQAEGISVLARAEHASTIWRSLRVGVESVGGRPAGDEAAEARRILRGDPEADRELSEAFNPLEAGLSDAVSFDKGCYVGQEVVARLRTYDKVSRCLIGLLLPAGARSPERGAEVRTGTEPVGVVTSAIVPPGAARAVAIASVKRRDVPTEPATLEVLTPDGPVPCERSAFPIPLPS